MKCVILAGGLGTRLSEETVIKPKPMVEIGGHPIIWHIMKIYSHYGINDFIICLGYKGYLIKEFFANYCLHMSNVTFDVANGTVEIHNNYAEKITINELARLAKMSRSVFVKQFEHYTNSTVNNYIMNTRLEKAISLLNTNASVSKIAQDCGFFDSSHFSRYFKQNTGCSPLEYRKNQNGNQSLYNKD